MIEIEKLDGASLDVAAQKRSDLLRLFPEAAAEGGGVDLERLRLAIGDSIETGKERYGLGWPGKADCFKTIQSPSMATLLPAPEKSVNFDSTENLIFEGDNLEVLKLLQKSHLGKIKMIYIDPPYNTGNDFIYPDDYSESLQTYLEYTGQVDSDGHKFGSNTDTDGRFHSKWLNMMYPRLYLARNLLREDGVIFISIDDGEVSNLRALMNEIFGEDLLVSMIVIQSNKRGQTYKEIAKTHEYVLVYAKSDECELFELTKDDDALPFTDSKGKFDLWELRNRNPKFGRHNRPNLYYPIYVNPDETDENGYAKVMLEEASGYSKAVFPRNSAGDDGCWRWGKDKLRGSDLKSASPVVVARQRRDGQWNIYEKSRKSTTKAKSLWTETDVISEQGTMEMGQLGLANCFDHPKPLGLVGKCIKIGAGPDDMILDFFAGSGTTGHAVMEQNFADNGRRRYILVQLPEPTSVPDCPPTIADIMEERIRRVISKRREANDGRLDLRKTDEDLGFRVFRLAQSNIKEWDADIAHDVAVLDSQLSLSVDHLRPGRTDSDILYEVILKSGYSLSVKVDVEKIGGKSVYSVSAGAFLICLERDLTLDLIRSISERQPERVLLLDEGFAGKDQLKTNAVQTFKARDIVFRTL